MTKKKKQWAEQIGKGMIAPSILSADFANLGSEVIACEKGGANWIHVDVMDGCFVPNLTIGPLVVSAIRPHTKLPLDCHLMVSQPQDWIEAFASAGADIITIHAEATPHLNRLLMGIKQLGCRAGVSINPATSLSQIEEVLNTVDLVLVMSVNPGFGGQSFIPSVINKIERLVEMRGSRPFLIQVDGGIDAENISQVYRSGCDVFVAGSAVFKAETPKKGIQQLREGINR